jgi:hypothetical protein
MRPINRLEVFMGKCKNRWMELARVPLLSFGLTCSLILAPAHAAADAVTVPEGTEIVLQLNKSLSTKDNREGDVFDAYVVEPVYSGERISIPRGSVISGSISRITRPGRFKGKAVIHLIFQSIQIPGRGEIPIRASLDHIDSGGNADIYTENVLADAIPAARGVGGIPGNSLTGTSPGITNVFWTRDKELEIHRGATMRITLKQDLQIPLKTTPAGEVTADHQE